MRDSVTEAWLTGQGISWEYHASIALDSIVRDAATMLNIRLTESLNQEHVMSLALKLEDGADLAAIVLHQLPSGLFGLINGLHRCEAYGLTKRATCDAYMVLTSDALVIDRLRRTVNDIEGLPLNQEARLEHAKFTVRRGGYAASDAARIHNVPYGILKEALLEDKVMAELRDAGIDGRKLSKTTIKELNPLGRPAYKVAVAQLGISCRLAAADIRTLVLAIRGANSDAEVEDILHRMREEHKVDQERAAGGRVRPPASPLRRIPTIIDRIEAVSKQMNGTAELVLLPEERRALVGRIRKAIKLLTDLAKSLEGVAS